MKIDEIGAVGKITKQNATKDAPIGSEFANVKKLGLGSGKPQELHKKARKNSTPNKLFNLRFSNKELCPQSCINENVLEDSSVRRKILGINKNPFINNEKG